MLGGSGYGLPLLLPHYRHLAKHCQSDKGDHLVPSVCAFQQNWDQTVQCKRLFTHLLQDGHRVLLVQLKCRTLKQGVPGIIISPSSIAVGAFGAFYKLHAKYFLWLGKYTVNIVEYVFLSI